MLGDKRPINIRTIDLKLPNCLACQIPRSSVRVGRSENKSQPSCPISLATSTPPCSIVPQTMEARIVSLGLPSCISISTIKVFSHLIILIKTFQVNRNYLVVGPLCLTSRLKLCLYNDIASYISLPVSSTSVFCFLMTSV